MCADEKHKKSKTLFADKHVRTHISPPSNIYPAPKQSKTTHSYFLCHHHTPVTTSSRTPHHRKNPQKSTEPLSANHFLPPPSNHATATYKPKLSGDCFNALISQGDGGWKVLHLFTEKLMSVVLCPFGVGGWTKQRTSIIILSWLFSHEGTPGRQGGRSERTTCSLSLSKQSPQTLLRLPLFILEGMLLFKQKTAHNMVENTR